MGHRDLLQKFFSVTLIVVMLVIAVRNIDVDRYKKHHKIETLPEVNFEENVAVRVLPGAEDFFLDAIKKAKERVWVGVYTFTLPSLREALLTAKER